MYWCENNSLTLSGNTGSARSRTGYCEDFLPVINKETDDCRKLHRKDVNNFSNHVVCVTAMRNAYRIVVGKLERDELLIEVFER